MPLAKTLAALDLLSDGRVIAAVGPGSSERDYDAVGGPYEERWERFDEAAAILRTLLRGDPPPETRRHYPLPDSQLTPAPRRTGESRSGSGAGARSPVFGASRASATGGSHPLTTQLPRAAKPRRSRCRKLHAHGRDPDRFPNALVTMWTWITADGRDADRVLREVLAPLLKRDPD